MKSLNFRNIITERLSILETKKEVRAWIKSNIKKFRSINQAIIAAAEEFGMEDEIQNKNHWLWKIFKNKNVVMEENNPNDYVRLDRKTGMYCVYSKSGEKLEEFRTEAEAKKWANENFDTGVMESVEQLDEALTLASDNLNLVKKTAQKLAKQSPDLTYYVVKHNERYMKGMKYAYYEVYQSVDMHLVRGKVKKIAGYGAKVDMRESVEELDEGTPAYRKAMAAYKNSDTKKVFDILKKKGFRAYAQSDTLVRNMLKKNKGNVQKAAAEIEKKYPGHFKESVELDEAQKRTFNKGDRVVGRRGNFKGDEAKVVSYDWRLGELTVAVAGKKVRVSPSDWNKIKESVELDEADNTAAVARQLKQAVKKYTTGNLIVRSKGGKTRFIMVAAGHIDNKLRKMMIDLVAPNANIHNKDDISYGNVTDKVISAETRHWVKALGLKESVEEDKKVTCPKCDGEGCEHCDDKGYHIESVELGEGKVPSRPTRIAVSKEFDKVTRSGKMDTMAAKKHLEKKFKITDVRIEKDKNGKPHVTYFQESVELDEMRPGDDKGHGDNSQSSRKITDIIKAAAAAKKAAAAAAAEKTESVEVDFINNKTGDQPMNESFGKALQNILESQYTPKKESADLDVVNEDESSRKGGTIGNALDLRAVMLKRAADAKKAAKKPKRRYTTKSGETVYSANPKGLNASTDNESHTGRDLDEKVMVGDQLIIEYLEGYFGGELNESTSDEDIMKAFNDILETADAVEEFMEMQEIVSAVAALKSPGARKLGRGLNDAVRTGFNSARTNTGV